MIKTFAKQDKPLLTCMVRDTTPDGCIATIRNAIYDGADAFGLHLSCLGNQYHNEDSYKIIFAKMGQRPVYLTNYRGGESAEKTDEQRMEELLVALKAGGTVCDVMGDTFDPSSMELTENIDAINKQMQFIDEVHKIGKEALISSHIMKFLTTEEVLKIALEHQRRGADISKIVVTANNEEEMQNLYTTYALKKELQIPFLFLSCGTHYKIHRNVGHMLGNCMTLCMQQHTADSAKFKPVLRAMKQVYDYADYLPDILL